MDIINNEEFKEFIFQRNKKYKGLSKATINVVNIEVERAANIAQTILEKEHEEFCEWLVKQKEKRGLEKREKGWFLFVFNEVEGLFIRKYLTFAELYTQYQKEKEAEK